MNKEKLKSIQTNPDHTKEMLRHSILNRKLNEAGLYMNPRLGRYINEAMQQYADEINSSIKTQLEKEIEKILSEITKVENQHPYKQAGNRDSYSEYNEGWSDACDVIRQSLIPKEDEK